MRDLRLPAYGKIEAVDGDGMVTIRLVDGSRELAHSEAHVGLKGLPVGHVTEWRPKSAAKS